jgi:hypothetical protein
MGEVGLRERQKKRCKRVAFAFAVALGACGGPPSPPSAGEPVRDVRAPAVSPTAEARGADAGAEERSDRPAPPARLEIALRGAESLALVEFLAPGEKRGQGTVQLVGELSVSITNPGPAPVRLVHMNPANFVFTRVDTGASFSLLHPCEPGLLVASMDTPPRLSAEGELATEGNTVFTLAPGATRSFGIGGDWGCGGGPWKPVPEPGDYRVEYRIQGVADGWTPPEPNAGASIQERLEAARAALSSASFWEGAYRSAPVAVTFGAPKARRLGG